MDGQAVRSGRPLSTMATERRRAVPINPSRIMNIGRVSYPQSGTRHTIYALPRTISLDSAFEQLRRFRPNAYAVQLRISSGVPGEVRTTPPIDLYDPGLMGEEIERMIRRSPLRRRREDDEDEAPSDEETYEGASVRDLLVEHFPEGSRFWHVEAIVIEPLP